MNLIFEGKENLENKQPPPSPHLEISCAVLENPGGWLCPPHSFPANSSSEVSWWPVFLAIAAFWPEGFAGATNWWLSTIKGGGGAVGLTY